MSSLTDMIERAILELIERHDGYCEIARNAFAAEMKVAPSQITYVISTRFGHEHGYIVESRRGGSGYIRIMRVPYTDHSEYIMHLLRTMDDYLTQHDVNILIDSLQNGGNIIDECGDESRKERQRNSSHLDIGDLFHNQISKERRHFTVDKQLNQTHRTGNHHEHIEVNGTKDLVKRQHSGNNEYSSRTESNACAILPKSQHQHIRDYEKYNRVNHGYSSLLCISFFL
jgi:transcriptional regulator CtsR